MRVILFNGIRLTKLILPKKIEGSFWLVDELTNDNNIINIEAENGKWVMKENDDTKIISNNMYIPTMELQANSLYFIEYNKVQMTLYCEDIYDPTVFFYKLSDLKISLGVDNTNDIIFNNNYIFKDYLFLTFVNGEWIIDINNKACVYINDTLLQITQKKLNIGDVVFILGLKIYLCNGFISINNPSQQVILNINKFLRISFNVENGFSNLKEDDEIKEIDYYSENDYFFKKPRLRRFIEEYELKMTPPPKPSIKEEMPFILVLGPMLSMAVISVVTLVNTIIKIISGKQTLEASITSLITSGAMLLSSLLWPNLTKTYQKKLTKRKEKERQKKYKEYIEKKKKEIEDVAFVQNDILKENLIPVSDCQNIILEKRRTLWERRNDQQDFLTVRVGQGEVPLKIKVNFSEEDFTMEEDNLRKDADDLIKNFAKIANVPVSYSFLNKKVTAIMEPDNSIAFIDSFLLQLMSFHSYDDLKFVFLISKKNRGLWEKYKECPHCFSNDKQIRFFADSIEDIKYISSYLEGEFYKRIASVEDETIVNENNENSYSPYYLVITDDYPKIRKIGIIEKMMKIRTKSGFSLVCVENKLSRLPSECVNFISLMGSASILCTDKDNYLEQKFITELDFNIDMVKCIKTLSGIPIEFTEDNRRLPTALGFLEMYNVGKIEQLNSLNRWRLNNPIKSLRAQVGINDEVNPIYLDLHEKYHGPHGLIAGTTGSGKSEFIITYILSMIVNYSPNEIAFILIDYKGGGLAGAFENKTQGIRLPHLAGTITNLDKASLNRTLVSIDSELKRRQKVFNDVRDKLGESTIDIYKYQKFFREGKIEEPMPHLFIISDEFAELKAQQPEFMDDLISAARIGRSLGVHLILATQKPSGVVNDQIWSNTKFRVCLKVQDRSDSNEMLKRPDAAEITNAGRFFLQVGNDEIFVLGQSGWAGTQYTATDQVKKKYDRSISFIDNVGNVIKNLSDIQENHVQKNDGDELSNIMKYICGLAKKENIYAKNLWLDAIPKDIYVDDIIKKFNYAKQQEVIAILGEYDAPSKQYQNILTLNLNNDGNSLIYGMSGSNREMLISSIIYSICINYYSDSVNIYLADFGSESLRLFDRFPQVGDIVYAPEKDKLIKLFSIVSDEIQNRKKLFADYNGDYKNYCRNSGKKIPIVLIIINNYDSFKENYSPFEDVLVRLTREGERYGIVFLISATNSRSIYSKLERNFHNTFVLDMSDKSDYVDILGRIGNVYPADFDGRGLYKSDEVYEFQSAQVCDPDNLIQFIKTKIEIVKQNDKNFAPKLPVLPEEITLEMFDKSIININELPVGITKKNLKICSYNFFKDKATIISSKKLGSCIELLKTIIYGTRKLNNMVVLIDTEQELSSIGGTVNTYADKNFEEVILQFEQFLDKEVDGKNIKVLCIIAGLEKFQGSINEKKFNGFFKGVKTLPNVNLIFVDSSYKLKKISFETWYTDIANNSSGIWVGPGFMEQTVISCSDYTNKFKEQIDCQYAWVAKSGDAELAKIVGKKEKEDEE